MKNFIKGFFCGIGFLYLVVGVLATVSPYWADKLRDAVHAVQD